jgi:hypothetical protein
MDAGVGTSGRQRPFWAFPDNPHPYTSSALQEQQVKVMVTRTTLSKAQEEFCERFTLHGNASEAFRRAYPKSRRWKPQNVHSKASHLLKTDKVQARILELSARIKAIADRKFDITAERVLQELALLFLAAILVVTGLAGQLADLGLLAQLIHAVLR